MFPVFTEVKQGEKVKKAKLEEETSSGVEKQLELINGKLDQK